MVNREQAELDHAIGKAKTVSRVIFYLCNIVTVLVLAAWVILIALSFFDYLTSDNTDLLGFLLALVVATAFFAWIVSFVRFVALIFSDILKGKSPFSQKQIARIRILSALMMVFFFMDLAFSFGSITLSNQFGIQVTLVKTSFAYNPPVSINGGALFMAVVLYCLSVFFEYGSLLQRLSDETG